MRKTLPITIQALKKDTDMGVILVRDKYKQGNTTFTQNATVNNGKVTTIAKVLKVREMNTRQSYFQ